MDVLITYNQPPEESDQYYVCHSEVEEQVNDVKNALVQLGHQVPTMSIGVNLRKEITELANSKCDLVFNLCESIRTKSRLQASFAGVLELLGIPFSGSGSEGIITAINKYKTKVILNQHGIPTPKGWLIRTGDCLKDILERIEPSVYPVIVKPNMEDGSIGITQASIAEDKHVLARALESFTSEHAGDILVEQYIDGREFNVGFVGTGTLISLPAAEIRFKPSFSSRYRILSYDAKWSQDSLEFGQFERICPPSIPHASLEKIARLGEKAYRTVGLSGYGRIDFRMNDSGELFVIDVNANPDLSKTAGLANSAKDAGIPYNQLIEMIIEHPYTI